MKSFAALLLVLLAAPVQAAIDQRFVAGETLDYNLAWSRLTGGSARMTIAPMGEDRYRITSIGKSSRFFNRIFKVRDELESVVARESFTTLQYRKILDERGRKKDELTVIDGGVATRKGKTISVPSPVFDPLSLMYYIRRLDMTPGRLHEFSVLADGKLYKLEARVLSRGSLKTPAGTFNTVLVEPKMWSNDPTKEKNRLLIWYSDDERRLPVRIWSEVNFGSITATLRAVEPGVTSTEPILVRDE